MRVIHVRDAVHHGVTQRYHCLRFPDGRHGAAAMCVETSVHLSVSEITYLCLTVAGGFETRTYSRCCLALRA